MIIDFLEKTESRFSDRIAYEDPDSSITYGKLKKRARVYAAGLIAGKIKDSIKPIDCADAVAFFMEKEVSCIPVMFGAMYAGAFYSFIDVRQTKERTLSIVGCLEPKIIVTNDENKEALEEILKGTEYFERIINISELEKYCDKAISESGNDSGLTDTDENALNTRKTLLTDTLPLYVNFTSGSTGVPKGVCVSNKSVIDFIEVFTKTFKITESDIIANQAPFDFDVSVKDIYSGLFTGAKVVLIPRPYFSNPSVLMDYLCDKKVTTCVWAVSAMCFVSIMNGFEYKTPETIDKVLFSGELMPIKQLNKWKKFLPDAMYVNLYGPTEITCNCTYHILDREYEKGEVIPIGIPFENEKVFLLDEEDRLIDKEDTEGEICVCGTCLALGYYKDTEKTDAAFMQNPLNKCYFERMYRTGDLGKINSEGLLVYTSRKDFQIKHMGQRIELGDIENSAMTIDGVQRACCLYDDKKKKILLYYVGEADKDFVTDKLHDILPAFMIPGKTTKINEFPLNKNGKIDRKELINLND